MKPYVHLQAITCPACADRTGETRYFTDDDLEVVKAVAHFRELNLPYDEIADQLRKGAHLTLEEADKGGPEPHTAMINVQQVQMMMSPLTAAADEWRAIAEERHRDLTVETPTGVSFGDNLCSYLQPVDSALRATEGVSESQYR